MSLWVVFLIVLITSIIADKTAYKRGFKDGNNIKNN
jgi:hypothetical protein